MYKAGKELPEYKCHKTVWALKIRAIDYRDSDDDTYLWFEEDGYSPIIVDKTWLDKHEPVVGGYFVVYKGGYRSFSPEEAFEKGYNLVDGNSLATILINHKPYVVERDVYWHIVGLRNTMQDIKNTVIDMEQI
jgi:hypothetical protein